MSTHSVDVIKISEIIPHPNADNLEIVKINDYSCCVRKGDFSIGELAVYVSPDFLVNTTLPEFSFLDKPRIKVRKLRGVYSQGLLVKARPEMQEGQNVMEELSIVRYEPPMIGQKLGPSESEKAPDLQIPCYDLENFRKYSKVFKEGEDVIISEKLHGTNSRFVWHNDRIYCGSHKQWKKEGQNVWWNALEQNPWIMNWCKDNPDKILFGEIFGYVQELRYGAKAGQYFFNAFDVFDNGKYWDANRFFFHNLYILNIVPILYHGPLDFGMLEELSCGKSTIPGAGHIKEGIVIKPTLERYNEECGRVALKLVSNEYLCK